MHTYELISYSDFDSTILLLSHDIRYTPKQFLELADSLLDEALARRRAAWAQATMEQPIHWSTLVYDVRDILIERYGFRYPAVVAYERDADELFDTLPAKTPAL